MSICPPANFSASWPSAEELRKYKSIHHLCRKSGKYKEQLLLNEIHDTDYTLTYGKHVMGTVNHLFICMIVHDNIYYMDRPINTWPEFHHSICILKFAIKSAHRCKPHNAFLPAGDTWTSITPMV